MKPVNNSAESTRQSGQALVETALIFVIVMLLLAGLVEFGWAYFRYLALQDAAAEGAAYGMMFPRRWDDTDVPADCQSADPNNITYRVQNESESAILDWSSARVDIAAPFITPGNPLTVTVAFDHQLLTPLLTDWIGDGSITLRATAVQTIVAPSTTEDNRCGP